MSADDLEALQQENDQLHAQVKEWEQRFRQLESEHQELQASSTSDSSGPKGLVGKDDQRSLKSSGTMGLAKVALMGAKNQMSQDQLLNHIDELEGRLEASVAEVKRAESELKSLKESNSQMRASLEETKSKAAHVDHSPELALRSKVTELEGKNQQLSSKVKALEEELDEARMATPSHNDGRDDDMDLGEKLCLKVSDGTRQSFSSFQFMGGNHGDDCDEEEHQGNEELEELRADLRSARLAEQEYAAAASTNLEKAEEAWKKVKEQEIQMEEMSQKWKEREASLLAESKSQADELVVYQTRIRNLESDRTRLSEELSRATSGATINENKWLAAVKQLKTKLSTTEATVERTKNELKRHQEDAQQWKGEAEAAQLRASQVAIAWRKKASQSSGNLSEASTAASTPTTTTIADDSDTAAAAKKAAELKLQSLQKELAAAKDELQKKARVEEDLAAAKTELTELSQAKTASSLELEILKRAEAELRLRNKSLEEELQEKQKLQEDLLTSKDNLLKKTQASVSKVDALKAEAEWKLRNKVLEDELAVLKAQLKEKQSQAPDEKVIAKQEKVDKVENEEASEGGTGSDAGKACQDSTPCEGCARLEKKLAMQTSRQFGGGDGGDPSSSSRNIEVLEVENAQLWKSVAKLQRQVSEWKTLLKQFEDRRQKDEQNPNKGWGWFCAQTREPTTSNIRPGKKDKLALLEGSDADTDDYGTASFSYGSSSRGR